MTTPSTKVYSGCFPQVAITADGWTPVDRPGGLVGYTHPHHPGLHACKRAPGGWTLTPVIGTDIEAATEDERQRGIRAADTGVTMKTGDRFYFGPGNRYMALAFATRFGTTEYQVHDSELVGFGELPEIIRQFDTEQELRSFVARSWSLAGEQDALDALLETIRDNLDI